MKEIDFHKLEQLSDLKQAFLFKATELGREVGMHLMGVCWLSCSCNLVVICGMETGGNVGF